MGHKDKKHKSKKHKDKKHKGPGVGSVIAVGTVAVAAVGVALGTVAVGYLVYKNHESHKQDQSPTKLRITVISASCLQAADRGGLFDWNFKGCSSDFAQGQVTHMYMYTKGTLEPKQV